MNWISVSIYGVVLACIATFTIAWYFKDRIMRHPFMVAGYRIHHSVLGAFLFLVGVLIQDAMVRSVGLGIYVSHVFEEMYFNKFGFVKSLSIFIDPKRHAEDGVHEPFV
jgi:hypothetical protein